MNPLASFLARYRGMRPPSETTAKHVSAAIEKVLGATVDPARIDIQRKTAFVAASSSLKSELVLRRDALLAETQRLGSVLEDIR